MSNKEPNKVLQCLSGTVMLGVSLYFGSMSKPTEMALAITAGFLGLIFANLDKFKSFRAGNLEAQLREEQIEAVLEKETETSIEGIDEVNAQVPSVNLVSESSKNVLTALQDHKYTWRYVSGLSKETNLTRIQIKESLQWLSENGYVKKSLGKNGEIWASTPEGRYLFALIRFNSMVDA
ncbi:hypothetical protein B6A42_23715 [Vibrio coralliilyticus]|nr:hypothetical protein B6A42_23715 [Vibrio coralliilyticus]